MAFELLGMEGVTLYVFIISVVLLVNWRSRKNFLRAIPLSKQLLGVIGLIGLVYVGSATAWWGFGAVTDAGDGAGATAGATFEVEGSESDAALWYDSSAQLFSCGFYENSANSFQPQTSGPGGVFAGAEITHVTATITVYDTTIGAVGENGDVVIPITAVVDTFYGPGENSSTLYYPVTKDTDNGTGKYQVAITPSGGSTREESNTIVVSRGSSKAVTVSMWIDDTSIRQMDNMDFYDVTLKLGNAAAGQNTETFVVRFQKLGETV